MDRQAIRIVPTTVTVSDKQVFLNKVPYDAKITRVGDYFVAETKFFFVLGNARNERLFKVLDKEYKRMPQAVFVAHIANDEVSGVSAMDINEWLITALSTRPSNQTLNLIAKAWGELKSRELNPLPGMAFQTDEHNNLITKFKPNQIAARFQLFRPTEMPYVVVDMTGGDLVRGLNYLMNIPPLQRKDLLITAMEIIESKYRDNCKLYPLLRIIPSGVGTTLGDIFSKLNILPLVSPIYPDIPDEDTQIIARVWKKQEYLGLGKGSIRVRSSLQFKLSHSSLVRTVTVRVTKELFKSYIKARVRIPKIGPVKSFKITDHQGERVNVITLGQRLNDAIDPWYVIPRIDLVYNGVERGYYVKFYIKYNYHAVRTGDKILSYTNEFLKGVAVVDESLPEGIDIECTWDNIKGFESQILEEHDNYVLIRINPASLFIVERGTSNARQLGFYGFRGHDSYEMMILNELFPDFMDEVRSESDPRLKYFPEALDTFYHFKVTVDKEISSVKFLLETENFLKGLESMYDDFEGGYVRVSDRKFPVPSSELIYSLANEYDSGISHSIIVIRYLRMLTFFVANGIVLESKDNPRDYRPDLKTYKKLASRDLYKLYKAPKLLAFSSIKRIINHMADVLHNVVAVSDDDFIAGRGDKYGIASVYPSVHPVQVKHKIVRIMPFSKFKRIFKEITGEELPITELHDAVLMSPHLVNNIFLKDNDGDALALRVPANQKLMKEMWKKVNRVFWKDIETMKLINPNTELWEELRPKHPSNAVQTIVTPQLTMEAMDKGISGKLMIGMITRQARRVQFGLIQLLKKYPRAKVVFLTSIIQIAKAMQDTIDGLKHDTAVKEATLMYAFLRDLVVLDWASEKRRKRIYARFFNSPVTKELRPFLPELKSIIDNTLPALGWLYGDGDSDKSVVDSFKEFSKFFKRISKVYY